MSLKFMIPVVLAGFLAGTADATANQVLAQSAVAVGSDEQTAGMPAAVLDQISGDVRVNVGEKFVKISKPGDLDAGDRVLILEGGSARLTDSSGCVRILKGPGVAVVGESCEAITWTSMTPVNQTVAVGERAAQAALAGIGALIIRDLILENSEQTASP